jgi:hypothetical protein
MFIIAACLMKFIEKRQGTLIRFFYQKSQKLLKFTAKRQLSMTATG